MNPRFSSIGPEVRDVTTLAVPRIGALEYVTTMTGVRLIDGAGGARRNLNLEGDLAFWAWAASS
ncbi:MAG: hypothetical protein ACLP1E_13825 [Acidimicrobiales bacterium]